MAALPPVPKTVRIDWHFKVTDDANAMIRQFYNYTGALSQADAQTWVAAASAAFQAPGSVQGAITIDTNLFKTELTDLTSNVAPQAIDNTSRPGSAGGNGVVAGIAAVSSYKIGRRYRGGHPRNYWPGISAGNLFNESNWTPAFTTNFRNSVKAFIAAVIAGAPVAVGTVTQVNVNYFKGFTNKTFPSGRIRPVPTPLAVPGQDLVTDVFINPRPASQRRRNLQSK